MKTEKDFFGEIENDLKIKKYRTEPTGSYYCRLAYSAISQWFIMLMSIVIQNESQDSIIKKSRIHRKIKFVLDAYIKVYPLLQDFFYDQVDSNPVNMIRDTLMRSGELVEIGFDSHLVRGSSFLFDETVSSYFISGMAKVSDSFIDKDNIFKRFNIPTESATEMLESYIRKAKWEVITETENYESFHPENNRILSQCWTNNMSLPEGHIFMVRRVFSYGAYDYQFAKREGDTYYISRFSDYAKHPEIRDTQRLLFALKKKSRNPMKVSCKHFDSYSEWIFWSKLPPAEDYLFRYIGWPLQVSKNQNNGFLIRNEFSTIVDEIVESLGIVKEEMYCD